MGEIARGNKNGQGAHPNHRGFIDWIDLKSPLRPGKSLENSEEVGEARGARGGLTLNTWGKHVKTCQNYETMQLATAQIVPEDPESR